MNTGGEGAGGQQEGNRVQPPEQQHPQQQQQSLMSSTHDSHQISSAHSLLQPRGSVPMQSGGFENPAMVSPVRRRSQIDVDGRTQVHLGLGRSGDQPPGPLSQQLLMDLQQPICVSKTHSADSMGIGRTGSGSIGKEKHQLEGEGRLGLSPLMDNMYRSESSSTAQLQAAFQLLSAHAASGELPAGVGAGTGMGRGLNTDGSGGLPPQQMPVKQGSTIKIDPETGKQICTFYMRTGNCAYRDCCKFVHPLHCPPPTLNTRGYPLRAEEVDCVHYSKKGWCAFGVTCKYNHPEGLGMHPLSPPVGPLGTPLGTPPYMAASLHSGMLSPAFPSTMPAPLLMQQQLDSDAPSGAPVNSPGAAAQYSTEGMGLPLSAQPHSLLQPVYNQSLPPQWSAGNARVGGAASLEQAMTQLHLQQPDGSGGGFT